MAVLASLAAAAIAWLADEGKETIVASGVSVLAEDPFRFEQDRAEEFTRRAAHGLAHPLFALSPGGIEASAERTARFEELVRTSAEGAGVEPATLEALVLLESAGRPEVIAGNTPESAAGIAQILPGTAEDLLGMSVDLERSKELTKRIVEQEERLASETGTDDRSDASRTLDLLLAERRRVDERFDPEAALEGAARYLALAEERFGREDLAVASYHMGMGNLEGVIEAYVSPLPLEEDVRATVEAEDLSYAQLYFDSSPVRNAASYAALRDLGDDSRHYFFRVEAAREVLDLWREDPSQLSRLAELHAQKASAEDVLRPPDETPRFESPANLGHAYESRVLVPLEQEPERLGYQVADEMGELAPRLGEGPELYRGLRPEALASIVYIAREMRAIAGEQATVSLTSSVRDQRYQELLRERSGQAARDYSLHTTGYAFDIARDLSPAEEEALVSVLERLRALNVVDWVYEPNAIHVTAGPEARRLLGD